MSEDLAKKHYQPVELSTLRTWIITAIFVNIAIIPIEWLRTGDGAMLSILDVAILAMLLMMFPEQQENAKRDFAILVAGIAMISAILRLGTSDLVIFDFWARAWLLIPAAITIWWISSPHVSAWVKGTMTTENAAKGLARNRQLSPKLSALGVHIILLHAVVLVLIPVIWILDIALSPGNTLGSVLFDQFSTEHFSKILHGESFWVWLRNSIIVSVGTTILGLALAIPAGYAFSRFKFSGREPAMFSFLLVQMFPGIIILVPYFLVMKSLGLLNSWLGLVLAYSVTALPLCVWMLKGFFDTVPKELEEAAILDGCNQAQVFRKVILPLSVPAIAVTALFSFLAAWNEFLLALTFNTSNDMYTLPVGLASMISTTSQAWGDFAAASILVSIPVVLLFIIFQRFLIEGLSVGGVKG
ncbi:MAG: sugar ABC transporter permease [Candidatus Thalassarchaeaceae archaeon]|nr:sugar ABC transporter permease [Candidatus Thalassarchaeaceae archaeon]